MLFQISSRPECCFKDARQGQNPKDSDSETRLCDALEACPLSSEDFCFGESPGDSWHMHLPSSSVLLGQGGLQLGQGGEANHVNVTQHGSTQLHRTQSSGGPCLVLGLQACSVDSLRHRYV